MDITVALARRGLLLAGSVLLAVACLALSGCGPGTAIYSKYGIEFEYPADFALIESGHIDDEPNDVSGIVSVRRERGGTSSFQVQWMNTMAHYDPETYVEDMLYHMQEAPGVETVEPGTNRESTLLGYDMVSAYYTMTTPEGDEARGVVASTYFKRSKMLLNFATRTNAVDTPEAAFDDFDKYMESFYYTPQWEPEPTPISATTRSCCHPGVL